VTYQSDDISAGGTFGLPHSALQSTRTRQPIIVFVGNCVVFSDRLLRLVENDFEQLDVLRLQDPSDLLALDATARRAVQMVVLDECFLDDLPDFLSDRTFALGGVRWVLAYRSADEARRLMAMLGQGRPVGFLPMKAPVDAWLAVLRLLSLGEDFLPGELVDSAVPSASVSGLAPQAGADAEAAPDAKAPGGGAGRLDLLTVREAEILDLVARGRRNKSIARELGLSEHTVKLHVHHIFGKLGVRNRTSATHWYFSRVGQGSSPARPQ
jgi:DNA-binding NarL/FixJ family response regulator